MPEFSVTASLTCSINASVFFNTSSKISDNSSARLSNISSWSEIHWSYSVSCNSSRASSKLTFNFWIFILASSDVSPVNAAICFSKLAMFFVWLVIFLWYSYNSFSFCNRSFCLSISSLMASISTSKASLTNDLIESFISSLALIAERMDSAYSLFFSSISSAVILDTPRATCLWNVVHSSEIVLTLFKLFCALSR